MRVSDIIRNMIDIVDQMHSEHPIQQDPEIIVAHPIDMVEPPEDASPFTHHADEINRFRQIVDLADRAPGPIGNAPNERYADIDSVTIHAGGGMNGPKHPHDLRVKDPSMYPNQQEF